MTLHQIIATVAGIGYIRKGSGTVAAAVCVIAWYVFAGSVDPTVILFITLAITAIGVWSATVVERYWGIDSHRVVIDEVAGMGISVLFLPVSFGIGLAAFVLFRFFDIAKPAYIRSMEKLPHGWGVMADDVLAGIYTNILLQVAVKLSIL